MARKRLIESPPPDASSSDEESEDESSSEEEEQEQEAAQDKTIKTQQNKGVKEQNRKPPAASSSDEESEDESSSEEEEQEAAQDKTIKTQQNKGVKEQNRKGDSSEDEEEDEEGDEDNEDDDEEGEQKAKPNQTAVATKSDSESTDTESSQPPLPSVSDFTIKPPISPKAKPKPVPKSESKKETDVARNDKKPVKRGLSSGTGSSRLWSDDDEIVILNGMIEYQTQKGKNPLADYNDFHEFVKESLHVDASKNQFSDKLRRLKKKYYTAVETNENGKDEIFTKRHDLYCVELAKKIWGAGGIASAKSKKGGRDGGSGGGGAASGGITLALAKGDVTGEKRGSSVKKQKRVSSEEANGEGKDGNLKKKKRGSNEDVDEEGKEVNVKKQKRVLAEEVSAEKPKRVVNEVNGGGGELPVKNKVVAIKELDGRVERNEDLSGKYPCLFSSFESVDLTGGAKERAIVMLGMVEEENLKELEREWRALMQVKLEVAVKEKVLIGKQIKLALDACRSQD